MPKLRGLRERHHQPFFDTMVEVETDEMIFERRLESVIAAESAALEELGRVKKLLRNKTVPDMKLEELLLVASDLAEERGYGSMAYGLRQYSKLAKNMDIE